MSTLHFFFSPTIFYLTQSRTCDTTNLPGSSFGQLCGENHAKERCQWPPIHTWSKFQRHNFVTSAKLQRQIPIEEDANNHYDFANGLTRTISQKVFAAMNWDSTNAKCQQVGNGVRPKSLTGGTDPLAAPKSDGTEEKLVPNKVPRISLDPVWFCVGSVNIPPTNTFRSGFTLALPNTRGELRNKDRSDIHRLRNDVTCLFPVPHCPGSCK